MARPLKFTDPMILQALKDSEGFKALAAKALGCSLSTVEKAAERNPEIAAEVRLQKETVLDLAEGKLYEAIRKGEAWAICFFLKTQGKARHYSERIEHTGGDGTPMVFTLKFDGNSDSN
jgi:hypothetical protein